MAKSAYNEIEETKEEETNVHFVKKMLPGLPMSTNCYVRSLLHISIFSEFVKNLLSSKCSKDILVLECVKQKPPVEVLIGPPSSRKFKSYGDVDLQSKLNNSRVDQKLCLTTSSK